ncbi:MAG: acyl-CoA thioesterase/bile acid-CoA:amino acid N-acyltransferase family protein [Anaerolineales bacterium]|jgi:esterase/lipase
MKLQIQPLVALCDEKIDIRVSELPPFGKVKISASMSLPWAKSVQYESYAWFTADSEGKVDLSRQKPDSGTYNFIDSMGPIVSMKSKDPKAIEKIGQNISVRDNIFIEIIAECEQDRASVQLERSFMSMDIKSQRVTDEFVGELFYTENTNDPTIVFLGGSGSGLAVNSPIAAVLASHGFNVLSVAYFGEEGLPAHLSEIPIEYFERVFKWLSKNPITSGREVWILGMSKGAELALLLASRYPFITRVALWAPHAYCFQGLVFKNVSSWTYAGKPLPFIRLKNRWVFANMINCFIKNEPFGYTHTFKKGLDAAKNKAAARIKVENAHADMLLVTSKQCNMWNTYDGSVQIMDTLRKCNYPHRYDWIVYEDAGEPYYVPYVIPAGESSVKMAPRLVLSMGGTLEGNARARDDSWVKTIEFFSRTNTK